MSDIYLLMMKQKQISKLLNVSQGYLSGILSGNKNITYALAKKLNNITHIEICFWMEASPSELKRVFLKEFNTDYLNAKTNESIEK